MNITVKTVSKRSSLIRKFEEEEWLQADIEHYGQARPFIKKHYKFVAYKGKTVVGILDLSIEANVAYIENLLVSSALRNQGVGKKLATEAESFAKIQKCSKIWLDTEEGWEAEKFYRKIGYQITGTHENHYLGKRGLIFTKFL